MDGCAPRSKTVARLQESYSGGKATKMEAKETRGRRKGNGLNPASGRPIYRVVHRISLLQFLPPYNAPQRLYYDMFAR
jgi:hypothetical protein